MYIYYIDSIYYIIYKYIKLLNKIGRDSFLGMQGGGAISDVRIVRIVSFFMGIGCAKAVDNLLITSFSKIGYSLLQNWIFSGFFLDNSFSKLDLFWIFCAKNWLNSCVIGG